MQHFAWGPHFENHREDVLSSFSNGKGWASPEWPSYLPFITSVNHIGCQNAQIPICGPPILRSRECMACIYALCVLTSVPVFVCLLVCRKHACHSPYMRRKDFGKNCSSDRYFCRSAIVPPHSCQRDCSTKSVWGCHASAEKVFIIPLLFKTLGARRV